MPSLASQLVAAVALVDPADHRLLVALVGLADQRHIYYDAAADLV